MALLGLSPFGLSACHAPAPGKIAVESPALSEDAIVHAIRDWYLAKGGPQRVLFLRQHSVEADERSRFRRKGLSVVPPQEPSIRQRMEAGASMIRTDLRERVNNRRTREEWQGRWVCVYLLDEYPRSDSALVLVRTGDS